MLKNPLYKDMSRRYWEFAIALGLAAALLWGVGGALQQREVAGQLVRLHILANSDSPEDQRVKLQVRDDLLAYMRMKTELPQPWVLEREAARSLARQGVAMPVRAERVKMFFDTREYDGFALPAGYYDAMRVMIGEGKGRNWWCVLFPPLCSGACEQSLEDVALEYGMQPGDVSFITRNGTEYRFRFKMAECIWNIVHIMQEF